MKHFYYFFLFFACISFSSFAQTISGTIIDDETNEPIVGASVGIKGTSIATASDFDGNFELKINQQPPFAIVVSFIGYNTSETQVSSLTQKLKIKVKSAELNLESVEVVGSRITEKQKESPVTIESMDIMAIKATPAASFYEGLGNLKGVDLTTASLGFTIVNTRGFNSTSPVRTLQLIDGVDNQAPGLNFSLGNFLGACELDVKSVELIVGANSATYGPNAFNGVISMNSKSPFIFQGLSVSAKAGERNLLEAALRYAKAFQNKDGDDKFAFKLNAFIMRAYDWEALNYDSASQSLVDTTNTGGYDAVNIYGDENQTNGTNNYLDDYGRRNYPGLGVFYRTGYKEVELVDYGTQNMKVSGSLHYMLTKDIEAEYSYLLGSGTTVYQGENRYSLKNILFQQHKFEISKPDKFFFRAYTTWEDAGKSYDAVLTAKLLQEAVKSNTGWSQDYSTYWLQNYAGKVWALPGFPPQGYWWFGEYADSTYALADAVLEEYKDSLAKWHDACRAYADGVGQNASNLARYGYGTSSFDSALAAITTTPISEGGSMLFDKSGLIHTQGEYKFTPKFINITIGASFRQYRPNSGGNIFSDTNGVKIINSEMGSYINFEKRIFKEKLILNATTRLDKNQNFDFLVSPAASGVFKLNDKQIFRLSFSSALRNPTLLDQYLYYDVGPATLLGNINGLDNVVTLESVYKYYSEYPYNAANLEYITVDPIRPEKVKSVEVGYKGTLFNNLFLDVSYYYSWYKDFIGFQIVATPPVDSAGQPITFDIYRVSANAQSQVTTQGVSVGANYYFWNYYAITGNYSWNVLNKQDSLDPLIPAFNTPEHKFNVGLNGRDMIIKMGALTVRNLGFSINYKWIKGFEFEGSPQFTGFIPTYSLLDAQINYLIKRYNLTVKIGASNLLNNMQYQTYGGPYIGRMGYASLVFELK
jgi:outer membrane cobalamin receptor